MIDANAMIAFWLEKHDLALQGRPALEPAPLPENQPRRWIARRKEYLRSAGRVDQLREEQRRGYYGHYD